MRLLTRYLAREIYYSIALVFAALLALFTFLELIREMKGMGEGSYNFAYMLLYITLSVPGYIYELLPVAVLVGTILALVQLASHSELTIYRASGASLTQMLLALFKIALPLVILGFVCSELIAPHSERIAKQVKLKAKNEQVSLREFRSGVWVKDQQSFVNVQDVGLENQLNGIEIFQFDELYLLRQITQAESASYQKPGEWQLHNIQRTHFDQHGTRLETIEQEVWHSALTPNILDVLLASPDQMSALDLYQYTNHLIQNQQKSSRYRIAMWNKLIYPFTLFVMMMLALPFASYHRRGGGVSGMIFTGIVLGLLFHFISRLFANLGALNDWQPFLSAATIPILFLGLGLALLWRSEKR